MCVCACMCMYVCVLIIIIIIIIITITITFDKCLQTYGHQRSRKKTFSRPRVDRRIIQSGARETGPPSRRPAWA